MSFSPGDALSDVFYFYKSGVLTTPASPPVITEAFYPDGTAQAVPISMTLVGVGAYRGQGFSGDNTASQTGFYSAVATTSDTTMDNRSSSTSWNVQAASSTPAGIAAAVWAYLTASITTTNSIGVYILAKLGLIGVIVNSISAQVQTGGLTEITEGSSYLAANVPANPLVYTISGLPLPTLASVAYWHGTNKTGGNLKIAGTVTAVDALLGTFDLTFDLTAANSAKLKSGNYSLHLLSSSSNALVVPNDTLIVNEAI